MILLPAVRRALKDRERRALFTASAGFGLNLLYALYNGALGLMNYSIWFAAMCAYYAILATMRFSAVLYGRKRDRGGGLFAARLFGALFIVLSVVLAGVVRLSLTRDTAVRHGIIVMITIATYTFTKITAAVIRALRARRNPSGLCAAIRSVGYAEGAASVFTLQKSMLVSFEGMTGAEIYTMNLLTGSAVWLFVFILGIYMMKKGGKKLWRSQSW